MRLIDYILAYSAMLVAIVPLALLAYKWKHLHRTYKSVALFLVGWLAGALISWFTSLYIGANWRTTYITSALMAAPLYYLLYIYNRHNRKILLAAAGCVVVSLVEISGLRDNYNWLSRSYLAFTLCVGLGHMALSLKNRSTAMPMGTQPLYYMIFALLLYYGGTLALDLGYQLTSENNALRIFMNARLCIALISMGLITVGAALVKPVKLFDT